MVIINFFPRDIAALVLEKLPPDPTNLEDIIHVALFSAQPEKALVHAAQLDPWLAAHMADVMEALALIPEEVDDECELSACSRLSSCLLTR
jgi:nuclear pore complex protein Nup85